MEGNESLLLLSVSREVQDISSESVVCQRLWQRRVEKRSDTIRKAKKGPVIKTLDNVYSAAAGAQLRQERQGLGPCLVNIRADEQIGQVFASRV